MDQARAVARMGLFAGVVAVACGASAQDYSNSLALTYEAEGGGVLPYRLFLPPGHDEPGASFPLVLHLHGAGERGDNNTSQLAYIDGLIEEARTDHPALLLVPQAPTNDYWGTDGAGGFSPATGWTLEVMAQIERDYSVDTERRYVTGLSMGGFGTWDLANALPTMFEAAVPMSSSGDTREAANYLSTRIWAFQGNNDTVTPPGPARDTIQAIRNAGGDPLYSEVLGNHGIWQPIYDDPTGELYDWMFDAAPPPLAELAYDPQSGTVRFDARSAPDGRIESIRFLSRDAGLLSIPETVYHDGEAVIAEVFGVSGSDRVLSVTSQQPDGFGGALTIPGLLPSGLDFQSLNGALLQNFYYSPSTGNTRRFFDVRIARIPEPSAMQLGLALCAGGALWTRCRAPLSVRAMRSSRIGLGNCGGER